MPTEELKFEELLKEYVDVIESTDVKGLKEQNSIMKVDIARKEREEEGIDARIEQIQSELDSLNENPTVKLEYPETIKDKEDKLKEAKEFKENKAKEIKELEDKTKANNKQIRKVNNIGKDVIKRAEEKTNKENEEIKKKIAELEERKAKYGIKRIDKDGNENIQLTKEEQIVVDTIDNDIKKLEKEIRDNKKAFLLFKKTIEETKKDKEVFLALKNKVKGKEEPKKEKFDEKPEQKNKEKPKKESKEENNDRKQGEILTGVNGAKVHFGDETKTAENTNPTVAESKKETERRTVNPTSTREGKGETKGRVIPGVPQPEHEIHEVKDPKEDILVNPTVDPTKGQDVYSNTYNQALAEYKMSLEMYDQDLETLYDLQQKYENDEIEYSEYEKHADYMVERYRFIKEEYNKVKGQYESEKNKTISNKQTKTQWHPDLTQEQIDYIKSELDIYEPVGQEYEQALRQLGLDPSKQPAIEQDETPQWHPDLTQEQIDYIKSELDIYEPVGQEYEQALRQLGIDPNKEVKGKDGINLEEPEKPEQPMMILEKEKGTKEQPEVEKTGLQIFREQLNKMPEIKDKHTLSERIKIASPLGVTAGVLTLANPVVGVPIIVGSMAAAPIARRLTGQKKLENQIKNQFSGMSEEEFNKMMDYLTEEKITELKPNAVILKAMHREMLDRTKTKQGELQRKYEEIENRRERLLGALSSGTLSKEEQEKANTLLLDLNKEARDVESEAKFTEKRLKDIQRGKDRVSAAYKGNLKTRFNIFAHRNTSSEKYLPVINSLADAELERDTAAASGDGVRTANADKKMEQIMQDNTHTNRLGVQNSIFNARQKPIKIISDRQDNTVRNTATAAVVITGAAMTMAKMAEFEKAQQINKANWDNAQNGIGQVKNEVNNITKNDIQLTADGQVTDAYAQAEHAIVHENGVTTSSAYRQGDIWAQQEGGTVANNSQVQGNDQVSWMESLIDTMKSRRGISQRYGNASQNLHLSPNAPDHTLQTGFTSNAKDQLEAEISFMEKIKDVIEKSSKLQKLPDFKQVKGSFLGPITTVIGAIMSGSRERQDNKEATENIKAVETKDNGER